MTFEEFFSELTGVAPTPEDIEVSKAKGMYFEHLPFTMQDKQEVDRLASTQENQEFIKDANKTWLPALWSEISRNSGILEFYIKQTSRIWLRKAKREGLPEEEDFATLYLNGLFEMLHKAARHVPVRQTFCRKIIHELLLLEHFSSRYPIMEEEDSDVFSPHLICRYHDVAWMKRLDAADICAWFISFILRDKFNMEGFKLSNAILPDEHDSEMQEDVANLVDNLNAMREQGINAISIKRATIGYMILQGHIEIDNPEHEGNWKWWALIQVWAELAKAEGIVGMGYSYQDGGEVSPKSINEDDQKWINTELGFGELYTKKDTQVIKRRLQRHKEWRRFYYDIESPHDELVQLCEEIRENALPATLS